MVKWKEYKQQSNNYENQNLFHRYCVKRKVQQYNQFKIKKIRKMNKNLSYQKFYNIKMSTILRLHKIIKSSIR